MTQYISFKQENFKKERRPLGSYSAPVEFLLKPQSSALIPPQIIVEPGFSGSMILSFLLHIFPLIFLFLMSSSSQHGDTDANDAPQVEMVFSPSVAQPQNTASQASAQEAAPPPPPPPQQAENAAQKEVVPTPDTPSSDSLISSDEGELAQTPPSPAPVISAKQRSETEKKKISHKQNSVRRADNNPFAHPMDLSFNSAPSSTPQHYRSRHAGKGRGIDMSLGPLSMNGQINAPYHTRTMVKGVSSDYGREIDQWVRAHMFYPEDAANNGEEGPSSVHVVIDRTGRVTAVRLTGQSGSYSLDAATSGMFQGAKLPPVPPDMSGDHFDLDVTINYILIRH